MKNSHSIKTRSLCSLVVMVLATSCQDSSLNQRAGELSVEFGFHIQAMKSSDSVAKSLEDADAVVVTIEDASGTEVYSSERVDLFAFGDDFVSRPLSLLPGSYELTGFLVVDANDDVLYATPLDGSPLAHLVSDPLPIALAITTDTVTTVRPQVLDANQATPEDFGYASFGLDDGSIVDALDFLVGAFVYDDATSAFVLTTADLQVEGDAGAVLFDGPLAAETNHVVVPDGHTSYQLTISKPGHQAYSQTFTGAELAGYFDSASNGPLEVVLIPGYNASCTHPSAATLLANDPSGVSDIQFDSDCKAYLSTIIHGTDYVYTVDEQGGVVILTGQSDHDIGAVGIHPEDSSVSVGYNNVGFVGVQSGSTLPVVVTGGHVGGSNWSSSGYLNSAPSSIAVDSTGCIWVPNWTTTGRLACVSQTGGVTTLLDAPGYIESVGLDFAENLYFSRSDEIYRVDTAGNASLHATANAVVLDFVFGIDGALYVETTGDEILLLSGGAFSVFATVTGDGKLAISPDGFLVRAQVAPVGPATYQEWDLN